MPETRSSLFGKTKTLENQIDQFLDKASEAGIVFEQGIECYLKSGMSEACEDRLRQLAELEYRCDDLRRSTETVLYTEMLIPDARGDVLSLLDAVDSLIDAFKSTLLGVTIEQPEIPEETKSGFADLTSTVVKCVEYTILATRAFFRDINVVRDHIHKIGFYESESDKTSIRLKEEIFRSELPFERKMHIRDYINALDIIADEAEDVGDHLSIYTIKRSL